MAVVELAIGGAGRGGGDQSRLSMSHRTPRATNSLSPELVTTHAMLPLGEAKCVNSTSTGMPVIDPSGAACATVLLGPMGCDCSVAGAEPSDRLPEGLPHPPSAITATTSKTSAAIIRASTHLPHDADGIAIDVLSRSAMGLTPHHGGNRRHPRTLGSFRWPRGVDDPFALAIGKLRTMLARRGLWRAGCGANSNVRFGRAA